MSWVPTWPKSKQLLRIGFVCARARISHLLASLYALRSVIDVAMLDQRASSCEEPELDGMCLAAIPAAAWREHVLAAKYHVTVQVLLSVAESLVGGQDRKPSFVDLEQRV